MRNNSNQPDAAAYIHGGPGNPRLAGEVRFYQEPAGVMVEVRVSGLPEENPTGFFALHIHAGGSCTGADLDDTLGHYNPGNRPHPEHAGDLPPLLRCGRGGYLRFRTDRFRVRDIIGRTLVIHSGRDDFTTQPAGDAGKKIACGIIRRL